MRLDKLPQHCCRESSTSYENSTPQWYCPHQGMDKVPLGMFCDVWHQSVGSGVLWVARLGFHGSDFFWHVQQMFSHLGLEYSFVIRLLKLLITNLSEVSKLWLMCVCTVFGYSEPFSVRTLHNHNKMHLHLAL